MAENYYHIVANILSTFMYEHVGGVRDRLLVWWPWNLTQKSFEKKKVMTMNVIQRHHPSVLETVFQSGEGPKGKEKTSIEENTWWKLIEMGYTIHEFLNGLDGWTSGWIRSTFQRHQTFYYVYNCLWSESWLTIK